MQFVAFIWAKTKGKSWIDELIDNQIDANCLKTKSLIFLIIFVASVALRIFVTKNIFELSSIVLNLYSLSLPN